MSHIEQVSFTVDAGIINRLGLELVSKSETALSELIKNAYDADAKVVDLFFINAEKEKGILVINDDGLGMTRSQLINGFMKLATSDKIHNSISEKFKRPKAGRKGIGRFSTQRLGTSLEIITKSESEGTIRLQINWEEYLRDKKIDEISNEMTLDYSDRREGIGTTLKIYGLREKWTDADIKRVYRYVGDLIQPSLMQISRDGSLTEVIEDKTFSVNFFRKNKKDIIFRSIADPQIMFYNKALATISGYIDKKGIGNCFIETKEFGINGEKVKLSESFVTRNEPFELLGKSSIIFKVYYFIGGDRNSYYGIPKLELKSILEHLEKNGGVKLYRNGFRVPKYGEFENDWLNIEKNSRIGKGIPFNNNRLLGFVQILDPIGVIFEESAGREGLIEKNAFFQLQSFISKSIEKGFLKFANWFRTTDDYKVFNPDFKRASTSQSVRENTNKLKKATKILNDPKASEEDKTNALILIEQVTKTIARESEAAINELEMMRVLAGTGLTIAEFIHEIKQIVPSIRGYLTEIMRIDDTYRHNFLNIITRLSALESYMSYFDETISKNLVRTLEPIDLRKIALSFEEIISSDIKRRKIKYDKQINGRDLFTTSMHPSELNTILQNLYSNAKKAIISSKNSHKGKILLKILRIEVEEMLLIEFHDNGKGIEEKNKSKIFNPFFTTTNNNDSDWGTGTGLGLYILSQMIINRNGKIFIGEPIESYTTNISIKIPIATKKELEKYGY